MDEKKKNPYSKGEGFRELRDVKKTDDQKINTALEVAVVSASIESPNGYYKSEGTIDQSLFIIISGGDKRERDYFHVFKGEDIRSIKRFPRIHIKFISKDGQGLHPKQMLDKAIEVKSSKRTEILTDKYFLVTDVDEFRNDILKIIPLCKQENLELIISNYCFEIWLYYGKSSTKPIKYIIPADKSKCSQEFKKFVHEESNGGIDSRKAIFDIENAIKNSETNYEEDEEGIPHIFSTTMHKLAKEMFIFIGDDLKKYIAAQKEKEENFRKRYIAASKTLE
ncbi:RloB family protein [Prevotella sp. 10(H)]|uniref:RloB family protein n=1 Tax=Prevotella sp. 10(H) TaxID=1158294 RepID=UPI0004A6DE18|nr:RloB family protein [Prevotella sp. 10(H)]